MNLNEIFHKITKGWVQAKNEKFASHPISKLIREDLKDVIVGLVPNKYTTKASAGTGGWASVPWVSILDPTITETTQSGIYPVYLFCADGSGVYLSLGFGTTSLKQKHGGLNAKVEASRIRSKLRESIPSLAPWDDVIDLKSDSPLGRSYQWASAGAKFYEAGKIPNDALLQQDLRALLEIYASLASDDITATIITIPKTTYQRIPKPFLLLAGLSGTGKTRFVREQATATGAIDTTYCLVSVRPDWHEPSDLLGYTSRLSGAAEYVTSDVLKFIVKAWLAILQSGLQINGRKTIGEKKTLDAVLPCWLCLDEMNLAPVEQYFADYLSVLETREWEWDGANFSYSCDPLLNASVITSLSSSGKKNLRDALGLTTDPLDRQNDKLKEALWGQFCTSGIAIPFNLIVAGTVNMDETTHGFSRKVLDRALTFDFGDFFPNEFSEYFEPTTTPKLLSYPIWSSAIKSKDELPNIDQNGDRSVAFLEAINTLLNDTPFKLAYRALNELLLSVTSFQPEDESELQSVWDDFLMCKVLPRIEGDTDKLAHLGDQKSLLTALAAILEGELAIIWTVDINSPKLRADLFRQRIDGSVIEIACRSQAKIKWMQNRLEQSGFTSFWP